MVMLRPQYRRTTAKRRRADPEHIEAVALMRAVRLHIKRYPDLRWLAHIPNGGARSKAAAGKLKAEGTNRGIPDYLMPVRRGPYLGLAVELKAAGGRASPEQDAWLEHLRSQGWRAEVAVGWSAAWELIREYLEKGN